MARKQSPVRYKNGMSNVTPHWSGLIHVSDLQPGMELMFTENGKQFKLVEQMFCDLMLQPSAGWVIEACGKREFLTNNAIAALSSSSRLMVRV